MKTMATISLLGITKTLKEEVTLRLPPDSIELFVFNKLDHLKLMAMLIDNELQRPLSAKLHAEVAINNKTKFIKEAALYIGYGNGQSPIQSIGALEELLEVMIDEIEVIDSINYYFENDIQPYNKHGPYECFSTELRGFILSIISYGDFRIWEWERDHLRSGKYR